MRAAARIQMRADQRQPRQPLQLGRDRNAALPYVRQGEGSRMGDLDGRQYGIAAVAAMLAIAHGRRVTKAHAEGMRRFYDVTAFALG